MTLVTPAVWKKHHCLSGSDKERSRIRAIEMFPYAAGQLTRKKDHARAEAMLIAKYGADKLGQTLELRSPAGRLLPNAV
jgi:crossover junction endodeoxyribonuclease RuvC